MIRGLPRKIRSRPLAVVVGCLLLLSGLSAGEVAVAHTFDATRSISLARRPTGKVKRGTRVTFFGRVRSEQPSCYKYELVELIRIGSGVVSSDITNGSGEYSMRLRVRRTGRYLARVTGTASGVHPNRHVCYGAKSNLVTVRVR
jgi:hypothetical protein